MDGERGDCACMCTGGETGGIGCGGKDGVCVCSERLGCACGGRDGCLCMLRDGRCVEQEGFVCVFVEKQEVNGGRDRGVLVCMWRDLGVVVES